MMKVVLCDSNTINSYGFRTDVDGIDLTRFKKNPVMLYNHNPLQVIGRWEHITADGGKLTAEPVFDMDDTHSPPRLPARSRTDSSKDVRWV